MTGERDEQIRKRAHAIWEKEGRPSGSHDRHWQQAESEIAKAEKKPAKAAAKVKAAKAPKTAKAPAKTKKK